MAILYVHMYRWKEASEIGWCKGRIHYLEKLNTVGNFREFSGVVLRALHDADGAGILHAYKESCKNGARH